MREGHYNQGPPPPPPIIGGPPPPPPAYELGGESDIESVEMDETRSPGTPTMHELDDQYYDDGPPGESEPKKVVFSMGKNKPSTIHQINLDAFAEEKEAARPPLPTQSSNENYQSEQDKNVSPTQMTSSAHPEPAPAGGSDDSSVPSTPRRRKSRFAPIEESTDSTQDKAVTSSSVGADEAARSVDDDLFDTALFGGKEQPESSTSSFNTSSQDPSPKLAKVAPRRVSPAKTQYQAYKTYEDDKAKEDEDSKEKEEDDKGETPVRRSRRLRNQDQSKPEEDKPKEPEKKKRGRGRPRKEKPQDDRPASPPAEPEQEPDLVNIVQESSQSSESRHKEFAIPDSVPTREMDFGSPSSRPEKVKSRWRRWSELEATNEGDNDGEPPPPPQPHREDFTSPPLPHKIAIKQEYASKSSSEKEVSPS